MLEVATKWTVDKTLI